MTLRTAVCRGQISAHETDHHPFRLHSRDYVAFYLPAAAAARMPAGYFFGLLSSSPCGSTHRCRANKLTAGTRIPRALWAAAMTSIGCRAS